MRVHISGFVLAASLSIGAVGQTPTRDALVEPGQSHETAWELYLALESEAVEAAGSSGRICRIGAGSIPGAAAASTSILISRREDCPPPI